MNFETSTHKNKWLLSGTELEAKRAKSFLSSLEAVKQAWSEEKSDFNPDTWDHISQAEEMTVQKYYQERAQEICKTTLRLPSKVAATAVILLKRFGLGDSLLEHDPTKLMLTAIYVACKAEENYIDVEQLCTQLDLKPYKSSVLENEVLLLQAVDFDMVIYNPFRPLDGLVAELREWLGTTDQVDTSKIPDWSKGKLSACHGAAISAVEALLLSDAPLMFSPGLLALGALASGIRSQLKGDANTVLDPYLMHVSGKKGDGVDVASMQAQLRAIDKLGAVGAQKVSKDDRVQALQRKLKECRSPWLDPKSNVSRQAREKRKRSKAERKASKATASDQGPAGSAGSGGAGTSNGSKEQASVDEGSTKRPRTS